MHRIPGWWFSVLIASACARTLGQETVRSDPLDNLFEHGKYEVSLSSGPMFSPIGANRGRPTLNYVLSGAQLGWMVTDVDHSAWVPGNLEVAGEVIGGAVFKGTGNYLAGGTGWIRYNVVPAHWQLIPYVEGGLGAGATDMDSKLISGRFAFNLNLGVGARYLAGENWSINLEFLYQHISNARLYKNDLGVNAIGPMLSVSYFF